MLIEVRTDHNFQGSERFSDQVKEVVNAALERHSDHVRVECQDAGGPWRGRHKDDDRPHGLSIVAALTGDPADWGVQVTGGGRIVWARISW